MLTMAAAAAVAVGFVRGFFLPCRPPAGEGEWRRVEGVYREPGERRLGGC